jgi:uncharacterized tellurite resistance protein B-like protein
VQFTRNPGGIAGALKKIGGLSAGSAMPSAAAREVSHIFFGQAQRFFLNRLMSTHPPLEARIRAVDPGWNGIFPTLGADGAAAAGHEAAPAFAGAAPAAAPGPTGGDALEIHASPDQVVQAIGRLDQHGLDQAAALLGGLPMALRDAAHDPFAGRALLYALVVAPPGDQRDAHLEHLRRHAERGVPDELARILPLVTDLDEQQKLTLVEMAIPALKELSDGQYRTFIANLVAVIRSDRRIDLLEWVLHRLLIKELKPHFEGRPPLPARHAPLRAVAAEAAVLLSALAREDERSPEAAAGAFAVGIEALEIEGELDGRDDPNFARLNQALAALRKVKPLQKPRLVKACAATVLADGHVSAREGALLQGIAAALDCPLPPSIYSDSIGDRSGS